MHTIKPLDTQAIINAALDTSAILTLEEHQITGGLGSAVAETLSEHCPTPIIRMGVHDRFGESGETDELLTNFGLKANNIKANIRKLCKRS